MRGAHVAVRKKRLHGDQPNATAQWLLAEPSFFCLFTSLGTKTEFERENAA
jgi:hypothetical protein